MYCGVNINRICIANPVFLLYNHISDLDGRNWALLDSLLYSTKTVLPVFLLVALGIFLRKINFLSPAFFSDADKFVFKIALPVTLFLQVTQSEIDLENDGKLVLYIVCGIIFSITILCITVPFFIKDNSVRGAFIQGAYRSNFSILGVPLIKNMFPQTGEQAIFIVMPFVIICFNVGAVIILSIFEPRENRQSFGAIIKKILLSVITNPLIIAVILGLPFILADGMHLPDFAYNTLDYIGGTAFALALISLGARLDFGKFRQKFGYAAAASVLKTIVIPLILVTAAALLGFNGVSLGVIFICFASPAAVSSYIMAKNMNSDADLAAQILLTTTLLSIFTLFAGVFTLKSLSLI